MQQILASEVVVMFINLTAQADLIRGELINDDDPYFVRAGGGTIYKVEWNGGSSLFSEGDDVILTCGYGFGKMISDYSNETADVWIEPVNEDPAISLQRIKEAIRKDAGITPTPTPMESAKPTPSVMESGKAAASEAVWPDGRKLLHPNQFVRTRVVNVGANDTLKLRSGPGTSFKVLAEIPADETNVTAFDHDQVWDGDSWWCPVEWKGLRGYVGRSHLPKP